MNHSSETNNLFNYESADKQDARGIHVLTS